MLKAIQDKLSDGILREFAKRYGADEESIIFCGGYESAVYSIRKSDKEFILKITIGKIKDIKEVCGELEFVTYLYKNGFGVSNVIFSEKGNLIEVIDCDDDYIYARCYSKANGLLIKNQLNMSSISKWGQTMGRLHKLSQEFIPSRNFYSKHWNESTRLYNDFWDKEIVDRVNEVVEYLQSISKTKDNYGLIHNDFHQENFFISNDEFTVIDFDDLGYSWYVYDISIVLYQVICQNVFAYQDKELHRRFFDCFIEGYCKEKSIDKNWIEQLPYFLRLRHLNLYAAYCQRIDFNHIEKYEERILLKYYRDIYNRKELINLSALL